MEWMAKKSRRDFANADEILRTCNKPCRHRKSAVSGGFVFSSRTAHKIKVSQ
jgi:hypothetical protein